METSTDAVVSTGIEGVDEVLSGGFVPRRSYLVRGGPGAGKTTFGLHFLVCGVAAGEKVLFITLQEPEAHIRENASRTGFDLDGVTFLDLSPTSRFFAESQTYDIFSPAEVEREPTTKLIVQEIETLQPRRVFLDPLTQFRYLAPDRFHYHRQVLSFLRFLSETGATVLFTSEHSAEAPDEDLQFLADGVINLELASGIRTIHVTKMRGIDFRHGRHAMRLTHRGILVYPRLQPELARVEFRRDILPSGVPEIDEMLSGGIERGTVTIITGPSGVGKTTLGLQFMKEAAGRGERSVVYLFEEDREILLARCAAINIPARAMMEHGTLAVERVEPLAYLSDEFAHMVRREVEKNGTRIVMLDSIAGYRLSIRGEDLVSHMHGLSKYLQGLGVSVILVADVSKVVGDFQVTEEGLSYLGDNVIFLRYLEMKGEMHKAIGILKKRMSDFEKTIREFEITRYGIRVGKPLTGVQGILTGSAVSLT